MTKNEVKKLKQAPFRRLIELEEIVVKEKFEKMYNVFLSPMRACRELRKRLERGLWFLKMFEEDLSRCLP